MKILNLVSHPVDVSLLKPLKRAVIDTQNAVSSAVTNLEKDTVSLSHEAKRATQSVVVHNVDNVANSETQLGDKMLKKLSLYIEKLPANAKMNHPVQVSENGNTFSFLVEKNVNGNIKVSVKEAKEGLSSPEVAINFVIDSKGNMLSGRCGDIVFERGRNNTRRLIANKFVYTRMQNSNNIWQGVKETHAPTFMPKLFDDSYLHQLFLKFANSRTPIFKVQ